MTTGNQGSSLIREILDEENPNDQTGAEHFLQLYLKKSSERNIHSEEHEEHSIEDFDIENREQKPEKENRNEGFRLFSQSYTISLDQKGPIYKKLEERRRYKRSKG